MFLNNAQIRESLLPAQDNDANFASAHPDDTKYRKEGKYNIFYTNADSLNNKSSELTALVQNDKFRMVCITETLPKNLANKEDFLNFEMTGFTGFHNNDGRGVSTYIDENLAAEEVCVKTKFQASVWVKLTLPANRSFLIGCIYRSPNSTNENNNALIKLLEEVCNTNNTLVIVGDFNYKEIDWKNRYVHSRPEHPAHVIYDKLNDLFLQQLVLEPTRYRTGEISNLLDWILTNEVDLIDNLKIGPPLGEKGDHCSLTFKIDATVDCSNYGDGYNYYKGDFDKMREELIVIPWTSLLENKSVEEAWGAFSRIVQNLVDKYVPRKSKRKG